MPPKPFARANEFVAKNSLWFVLGLAILFGGLVAQIRIERDADHDQRLKDEQHVRTIVAEYDAQHAALCASARARRQTVVDFWNGTGNDRAARSLNEHNAQLLWGTIETDFATILPRHPALEAHLLAVSDAWGNLSLADGESARRAYDFVRDLHDEYNRSCAGPIPTPRPQRYTQFIPPPKRSSHPYH